MLKHLLLHAFDRQWVAAISNFPNPPKQSLFRAIFTLIGEGGGELVYVG